jgi:hypothetical protein
MRIAVVFRIYFLFLICGIQQLNAHEYELAYPHTHLEVIPFVLYQGSIRYLHPENQQSLVISCVASMHPSEQVEVYMKKLGIDAKIIHSTSWRFDQGVLTLTYIVILDALSLHQDHRLRISKIESASIVHGTATKAPKNIEIKSVIYHALTHLSWLSTTDKTIASQLSKEWMDQLKRYAPEPFLQLP